MYYTRCLSPNLFGYPINLHNQSLLVIRFYENIKQAIVSAIANM